MPAIPRRAARHFAAGVDAQLAAGHGLLFVGNVGTGKTTLAMLVARAALEAQHTVAIFSAPRLLNAIRRTYDEDSALSDEELIDRLVAVDLLHVDDLGVERTSDWVLEQLYAVVNGRYEAERSCVMTANIELGPDESRDLVDVVVDQLGERIGRRTASRLVEMCALVPVFGRDARSAEPGVDHERLAELDRRSGRTAA
jgi:DNA replication protein DnaC